MSKFRCKIVNKHIKKTFFKLLLPPRWLSSKQLNRAVKAIRSLPASRKSPLRKVYKNIIFMIVRYEILKNHIKIRVKDLIKPIKIFYELTRTLYNKKLRNQEEKEKKRDGSLKDILTEKMTNSLRYFTSKNIAL